MISLRVLVWCLFLIQMEEAWPNLLHGLALQQLFGKAAAVIQLVLVLLGKSISSTMRELEPIVLKTKQLVLLP